MLFRQPLLALTALDGTATSAVSRIWIRRGIEVPAAMEAASALRSRMDAVSGCVFVRQSVTYPAVELHPAAPDLSASATRVGVLIFETTEPGEYAIIELPGLLDSFLLTEGPGAGLLIDRAALAVQALVDELINGPWFNPFGYKITALDAAFLQIRP